MTDLALTDVSLFVRAFLERRIKDDRGRRKV
mgnify:CR=1 FL=1